MTMTQPIPTITTRMVELLRQQIPVEGLSPTPLSGVHYMRNDAYLAPRPVIYDPGICIVASGRKRLRIGGHDFAYDADNFLVLSVPLPIECEVFGSPENPVLGILMDIDHVALAELLLDIGDDPGPAGMMATQAPPAGIYASSLTDDLRSATLRLLECFAVPTDAKILGPAIVREITYRILRTDQAPALRAVAARHSRFTQISRALQRIHADYASNLSIDDLASEAAMSPSSFHENFRAVTATSPLQYLKTIRIHKARLLMIQEGLGAAQAAMQVGYESASQFSREFKRLFGTTPAQDAATARAKMGTVLLI